MDTLAATLIAWIAAHSSLGAASPPHIQFVPKQEMTRVYQGAGSEANFLRVEAFYLPATATIYLPKGWRAGDLRDDSVLVHELVHHLQAANKVRIGCPAALERQAYALQLDWLREQGIADPYDFASLDILTVIIAGSCPE
jgi:hypothetical protein